MEFPAIHEEAFGFEEVYIHQEDVNIEPPEQGQLKTVLLQMANLESAPLRELNYIFCSDAYLLELNRSELQHDYYTDVITFPHLEGEICGDVFISTDRVAENAKDLGVTFERELLRVMLHGALHLAGYSDKTPENEAEMRAKEDAYLRHFSLT
jgi:probable rRNA maturation factor